MQLLAILLLYVSACEYVEYEYEKYIVFEIAKTSAPSVASSIIGWTVSVLLRRSSTEFCCVVFANVFWICCVN